MRAMDGLRALSASLTDFGIENAHKEAESIFTCCLGVERVDFYRDNPRLTRQQEKKMADTLDRRKRREPLQYIIGHVDFCGLRIKVGPGVLIPRPETELLVEEVLNTVNRTVPHLSTDSSLRILDLCTGSGCLALALAKALPRSQVFGTDTSERALAFAEDNSRLNGITNVSFHKGDLYEPVRGIDFDVIVSNPPYVKRTDLSGLQPEIASWEPIEALDGGDDGLAFYRKMLPQAKEYLRLGGFLVVELGEGQWRNVIGIVKESGIGPASVTQDYAGIQRILRITPCGLATSSLMLS